MKILNMNNVILDASAVLSLLNKEPGHDKVEKYLQDASISSVNLSEVIAILINIGMPEKEITPLLAELIKNVVPFDETQALTTASLIRKTKPYGLSLGDRACLALGILKNRPVLTCDKAWGKLEIPVKVILLR